MFLELSLASIALIFLVVYLLTPDSYTKKCAAKIPGPPPYPLIGNLHEVKFKYEGTDLYLKTRETYGDVVRYWLGPKLAVILSDPDDAEILFRDTQNLNKSHMYKFLEPWLGTGLLTSRGYKWHLRRKAITPTFHFKVLQQFLEVFERQTKTLIETLSKKADGKVFDILPIISNYSLDVICETAMGAAVGAQSEAARPYVESVKRVCDEISDRIVTFWLHPTILFKLFGREKNLKKNLKEVHGFAYKVMADHAKRIADENANNLKGEEDFGIKKKTAFLELLLKMKAENNAAFITDDDIREEVDTFMFAGHDTTANALSFALHALGQNPEIQEKAFTEVYEILGKHSGPLTMDILYELKYLDMVIKETLRKYPSVPMVAREISKDIDLPSGYTIPAGSILAVAIGGIHFNQKYYPNPEVFDPDRFLPEVIAKRHPYSYVPFSAGPRNCMGQKYAVLQMKATLSQILLHFEIGPGEDVLAGMVLTLQSENGQQVSLRPRKLPDIVSKV